MSENEESGRERWAWFDRWTQKIIETPSYPAIWDEMKTERFKPTIVWCEPEVTDR